MYMSFYFLSFLIMRAVLQQSSILLFSIMLIIICPILSTKELLVQTIYTK
nr:MAG TPA: hypothetical protein [Caudoviricetes sp.]